MPSKPKVYPNPSQKTIELNVMLGDIEARYPISVLLSLNSKGFAQYRKEVVKLIGKTEETMLSAKDGDTGTIAAASATWGVGQHMLGLVTQLEAIAISREKHAKEFLSWLKEQKFDPVGPIPLHPPIGEMPSDTK